MKVLVACEFSGAVRSAFRCRGHDAWSCDMQPAEDRSPYHFQQDARIPLYTFDWDLLIAHPPCTHLAVSGARWFKEKEFEQDMAVSFVRELMWAPIHYICIENPISIIGTKIRSADQVIQPWQFGHGETKATCLWLKNLPRLKATKIVEEREARIHRMPPSPDRSKERSRTYRGIAEAMAEQWGAFCMKPLAL